MTLHHSSLVAVLLCAAAVVTFLAALGLWLMRGPFNKLHYVAPVSLFSSVLITVAVIVEHPDEQSTIKVAFTALAMLASSPVVTHLTARSVRHRHRGELDIKREEVRSRS